MNKLTPLLILLATVSLFACTAKDPVEQQPTAQTPTGVRLSAATETSLTFTWDALEGVQYYRGELTKVSGDLKPNRNTSAKNSITYDRLDPYTEYSFRVQSVFEKAGESSFSTPVTATTGQNVPVPDPDPDPTPDPSAGYSAFMIPAHEETLGMALAFPGAEGGGMYTAGGRGGRVLHVTNLNDSGAGSLRAALEESGARTIVFDVAGVIELTKTLSINNGNVTVAGQTAPGDGICIKNYSTQINASNVIIRFVRFRMGDEKKNEGDAIWGRYNSDIILDHCSMSWSTDECASFYANKNFTMQWCVMTESLRNSVHGKGKHGYGGIWGGKNASFHHNLLANHDSRNPRLDHPQIYGNHTGTHRGNVDYRNNVVFNWGDNSSYGGEGGWFNMVNNYYKKGKASKDRKYFLDVYAYYEKDGTVYADSYPDLYLSGNLHVNHSDITSENSKGLYWHNGNSYDNYGKTLSSALTLTGPSGEDIYTMTQSAEDAFGLVCEYGGASLNRDSVDGRASADAKSGNATITDGGNGSTGGLIDTQSAVGGWPSYTATADELSRIKDTDRDGMPDWFEDMFGLDKAKASDTNEKTLDERGRYTNLEMYLHYIVREIVDKQSGRGNYQKLS